MREFSSTSGRKRCEFCKRALKTARTIARRSPEKLRIILDELCKYKQLKDHPTCDKQLYRGIVQTADHSSFFKDLINVLTLLDADGQDGQYFCHYMLQGMCELPQTPVVNVSHWFPPKPAVINKPVSVHKTFRVLHLSDIHLSLDYLPGSEGNCIGMMCCTRASIRDPFEKHFPAPKLGYYRCDSPPGLVESSLESARGVVNYDFALFTGDMVDHSPIRITFDKSVEEEERVMTYLKDFLGNTPVYAVLGNHDSYPFSQVAQHSSGFASKFSFNTDLMANLWEGFGWLGSESAHDARMHYGGYAVTAKPGLKIISLNSNFWYRWNFYNYWDTMNPDSSGIFKFLIDELSSCERQSERAWIIAHVPPGGIPDETMPISSEVFYQIIERFSPETIAGLFFGHTHQDEFTVVFSHNATRKSLQDVINMAWVAPSVTPLSNFNPGWRYYEVDTKTFEVMDSVNYYADLQEGFNETCTSLHWRKLYSAREMYDKYGHWPLNKPLNGEFWYHVAEGIKNSPCVGHEFMRLSYRNAPAAPDCYDRQCRLESYCYATSLTVPQAIQCREDLGVKTRKMLTGAPTYPMPRPLRNALEA